MVTLRTPNAPATKRQLWLLHLLTKTDTRGMKLTMQEASDRINALKGNGKDKPQATKRSTSRRHWGIDTFVQTEQSDLGKHGYCSKCYGDMQIFNSDGIVRHYESHKTAKALGLWGKQNKPSAIAKLDKRYHGLTGQGLNLGKLQIVQAFKEVTLHHNIDDGHRQICVSLKASAIFPGGKKPHIITEFIKHDKTVTIAPLYAHLRHYPSVDRTEYHNWIKNLPIKFSKTMPIPESWHDKALELAQTVDKSIDILDIKG